MKATPLYKPSGSPTQVEFAAQLVPLQHMRALPAHLKQEATADKCAMLLQAIQIQVATLQHREDAQLLPHDQVCLHASLNMLTYPQE